MGFSDSSCWRVLVDDRGDHFMYFDAALEGPGVRGLTEAEKLDRLDKLGSVSALTPPSDTLANQMDAFDLQDEVLEVDPSAGFVESMTFYMKGD